ncbi:MAG: metal ABC transporter permease [Planctomycetota bacterium]|nr:metal ABC transporter permease [Planctomycetota bacterium]
MADFIDLVLNPEIAFMRYALAAGVLSSIAMGIIGTYVVARRLTYLAGAIAHSTLGGIGAGLYLRDVSGWHSFHPMYGAVAAAIVSALVIGLVSLYAKEREDTVISAIWVVGMSLGIILLAKASAGGDAMSYLFGSILFISPQDIQAIAIFDVFVVLTAIVFHNKLLAVCFDEEFARLRGIRSGCYYLLLLCITALAVVLLVRVVGIVMVIALLFLPAAVAGNFAGRLWQMMVLAIIICSLVVTSGLAISYTNDLEAGPTIVLLAGTVYLLVAVAKSLRRAWFVGKASQ